MFQGVTEFAVVLAIVVSFLDMIAYYLRQIHQHGDWFDIGCCSCQNSKHVNISMLTISMQCLSV